MMEWSTYKEKYEYRLTQIYDIIDNPKANGGPSKWDYTSSGLKGHDKAISQTAPLECSLEDSCFATLLVLKIFRFYDFTLKTSVNMMSEGIVGIMFRVQDSANYYVFEMKGLEYKRVRRVVRGESTTLVFKKDGGFNLDMWYRVQIKAQKHKFTIQVEEESKVKDEDTMPVVL